MQADIKYVVEQIQVILINKIFKTRPQLESGKTKKYFFSFYTQTINTESQDIRYGDYVTHNDRYYFALLADGMYHQIPPLTYLLEI